MYNKGGISLVLSVKITSTYSTHVKLKNNV